MKGLFSTVSKEAVLRETMEGSRADTAKRAHLIQVIVGRIPSYLHGSDFYLNLDRADPDGVIYVPEGCFKENEHISNLKEFGQLLQTISFWGFMSFPTAFSNFVALKVWTCGALRQRNFSIVVLVKRCGRISQIAAG